MDNKLPRQAHAVLNLASRQRKAEKIRRLLALPADNSKPLTLLEIGTGSGGIAHYLATLSPAFQVFAVDTVDNRQINGNYHFRLVTNTHLPFDDSFFDIVITNHVIEHVGEASEQAHHLEEIARVLKPGGKGYLAVPNRWMLVEPHYRLAFLSYLPRSLRSPYLRLRGKGHFYDCEPLTLPELEKLLQQSGLQYHNLCAEALKQTLAIEHPTSTINRLVQWLPTWMIRCFSPVIPTLIYCFEKKPPSIDPPL